MKAIVALYVASIIYSVIRYVAFAPKNAENIPVFIVNKGVAMAAALCFAIAYFVQFRTRRAGAAPGSDSSGNWFRAGIFGAIWHVPTALVVLRPAYFKEFFAPATGEPPVASGRLSLAGELVFCFGGLAAGLFFLLMRQGYSPVQRWALSLVATAVLLVHVLAMGYCRGLNINSSHAYMPPMWFLSALGIAAGLVVLAMNKPRPEQA
jgi:hypothetical protein